MGQAGLLTIPGENSLVKTMDVELFLCGIYMGIINNVLLVKIEGPVWYTIYQKNKPFKGGSSNPSINQPTKGKRTSTMGIIYPLVTVPPC